MKELEEQLQERAIQPTAMRLLVLQYMMQHKISVSLKSLEVYFERADRSTLFRTLQTFEKQQLIHKIDDGTGVTKYALCLENCECAPQDQHFHFHCNQCTETFCLTDLNVPKIELPNKFFMQQANLVIKGICANCNT